MTTRSASSTTRPAPSARSSRPPQRGGPSSASRTTGPLSSDAPRDPRAWAAPPPPLPRRLIPILTWLPAYDRRWLRFDVIAGATVWGLLVPEMIAYAGLAGLPPQAGLYTLLVTLVAYAVMGTSRHVVVAGTSGAAVLVASAVSDLHPAGADEYGALAAGMIMLAGAMLLLAGLLRLGFIAQFLSRPIMAG